MMGPLAIRLLLCGLALGLGVTPATAQWRRPSAEAVRKAQTYVDRGDHYFDERKFELAIAEYTAALVVAPHPDLVWNIGRAHEEMRRYSQAVAFFERYREMATSPDDVALADKRIVSLGEKIEAMRVGRLVVETPSETAEVTVSGVSIGRGRRRSRELKPGRYRVRVAKKGYLPFERIVQIKGAETTRLVARLELAERRGVLVVITEIPEAQAAVDGGEAIECGLPMPLTGGAHKVTVTAGRRDPVVRLFEIAPGERKELKVALGPERPPPSYPSWTADYRVLGVGSGAEARALDGARLALRHGPRITGRLEVTRRRTLKRWRRSHCGGDDTLDQTWRWQVKMTVAADGGVRWSLSDGEITGCSCDVYCELPSGLEPALVGLPGREGMVSDELVVLRETLIEPGAGAFVAASAETLRDTWTVVRWRGEVRKNEQLVVHDEAATTAVLERIRRGDVPTYQRSRCPGEARFEQALTYPVVLTRRDEGVMLKVGAGREASCSCAGACGNPPSLADHRVRLLALPRYLVGDGTILRRGIW